MPLAMHGILIDSPLNGQHPAPQPLIGAAAVARGIARLFARNQIWVTPEIALPNGRRVDLMGLDAKGQLVIVEIKVSKADLLGDHKWPEYLDYCDRFYWGLPIGFDSDILSRPGFMPERAGLIMADAYDAQIIRPAASQCLSAARRKSETSRLARAALRRLSILQDPTQPAPFGE